MPSARRLEDTSIEGVASILFLDMATKTGWALWREGAQVKSGVFDLMKLGGRSHGIRFRALQDWLTLNARDVDLIAYEMPHYRGRAATSLLVGLQAHLQSWCSDNGKHEPMWMHSATIKKFATGEGKASKEQVAEAVKRAFPHITPADDNESDALAGLLAATEKFLT